MTELARRVARVIDRDEPVPVPPPDIPDGETARTRTCPKCSDRDFTWMWYGPPKCPECGTEGEPR